MFPFYNIKMIKSLTPSQQKNQLLGCDDDNNDKIMQVTHQNVFNFKDNPVEALNHQQHFLTAFDPSEKK